MTDTRSDGQRRPREWAEIRRRIDDLGHAIVAGAEPSEEEAAAILSVRARALATPPAQDAQQGREYVSFDVEKEVYAIESRFVVEVSRGTDVALIPGAKPPILGIAAWRGELLFVLDTRQVFGLPQSGLDEGKPILVIGEDEAAFGIPVDSVQGLREIASSSILPLPGEVASRGAPLAGITSDAVLILAPSELLRTWTGGT